MRRIDTIIGAVLVAAVLFSALGLATYEREAAGGLNTYEITWMTDSTDYQASSTRAGSGDINIPIKVSQSNLTEVQFTVTVASSSARVQDATVTVTVTPPGMRPATATKTLPMGTGQSSIEIPLTVTVRAAPTNETVESGSQEEANATVAKDLSSQAGRGQWMVKVNIQGGGPGPVGGAANYSANVAAAAKSYRADVHIRTPDVGR